jgi:hypothetical protein
VHPLQYSLEANQSSSFSARLRRTALHCYATFHGRDMIVSIAVNATSDHLPHRKSNRIAAGCWDAASVIESRSPASVGAPLWIALADF